MLPIPPSQPSKGEGVPEFKLFIGGFGPCIIISSVRMFTYVYNFGEYHSNVNLIFSCISLSPVGETGKGVIPERVKKTEFQPPPGACLTVLARQGNGKPILLRTCILLLS